MVQIIMDEACADAESMLHSDEKIIKYWIIGAFMFATVWTIGATVDEAGREKFNAFLKELIAGKNSNYPIPSEVGLKIDIPYPKEGSVYDYKYLVSVAFSALS